VDERLLCRRECCELPPEILQRRSRSEKSVFVYCDPLPSELVTMLPKPRVRLGSINIATFRTSHDRWCERTAQPLHRGLVKRLDRDEAQHFAGRRDLFILHQFSDGGHS